MNLQTVLLTEELVTECSQFVGRLDLLFAEHPPTRDVTSRAVARFLQRNFNIQAPASPNQHQVETWKVTIRRLINAADTFTDQLVQVDLFNGVINYTPIEEHIAN